MESSYLSRLPNFGYGDRFHQVLWLQALVICEKLVWPELWLCLYKEAFCCVAVVVVVFSQDLRDSKNPGTNFYVNFLAWYIPALPGSVNTYLKPTGVQACGYKLSGETFFPYSSAGDREDSLFPPSVDSSSPVLREHNSPRVPAQNKNFSSSAPPCGYPLCLLPTSPFLTQNGNDLQGNRNLSTCFSDFCVFWAYKNCPSIPERKEKIHCCIFGLSLEVDSGLNKAAKNPQGGLKTWKFLRVPELKTNYRLKYISLVNLHLKPPLNIEVQARAAYVLQFWHNEMKTRFRMRSKFIF